jgi:hypothetical protein
MTVTVLSYPVPPSPVIEPTQLSTAIDDMEPCLPTVLDTPDSDAYFAPAISPPRKNSIGVGDVLHVDSAQRPWDEFRPRPPPSTSTVHPIITNTAVESLQTSTAQHHHHH